MAAPQELAEAFVKEYYEILNKCPENVHKFYQEHSLLGWPGPDGIVTPVTGLSEINDKIMSSDYKSCSVEIETSDAQESAEGGIIVAITGSLIVEDNVEKNFNQTFFLAKQEKGFFVLNDILRIFDAQQTTKDTAAANSYVLSDLPAPCTHNSDSKSVVWDLFYPKHYPERDAFAAIKNWICPLTFLSEKDATVLLRSTGCLQIRKKLRNGGLVETYLMPFSIMEKFSHDLDFTTLYAKVGVKGLDELFQSWDILESLRIKARLNGDKKERYLECGFLNSDEATMRFLWVPYTCCDSPIWPQPGEPYLDADIPSTPHYLMRFSFGFEDFSTIMEFLDSRMEQDVHLILAKTYLQFGLEEDGPKFIEGEDFKYFDFIVMDSRQLPITVKFNIGVELSMSISEAVRFFKPEHTVEFQICSGRVPILRTKIHSVGFTTFSLSAEVNT